MKKTLALVLLAVALTGVVRAQTPVSVITMIGSNPTFDSKGTLLSAPVQSLWLSTVTVGDQTYASQSSVSWDGNDAKTNITLDGLTLTYRQVTLFAAAIAAQEKAAGAGTQAKAAADAAAKAKTGG